MEKALLSVKGNVLYPFFLIAQEGLEYTLRITRRRKVCIFQL